MIFYEFSISIWKSVSSKFHISSSRILYLRFASLNFVKYFIISSGVTTAPRSFIRTLELRIKYLGCALRKRAGYISDIVRGGVEGSSCIFSRTSFAISCNIKRVAENFKLSNCFIVRQIAFFLREIKRFIVFFFRWSGRDVLKSRTKSLVIDVECSSVRRDINFLTLW